MFVVLLRFSENKNKAGEFMDGHNEWIANGFKDGVFLLVGSLQSGLGGSVIAHNLSLSELQERVKIDPFVSEKIVTAEILEIEAKKADERLSFLVSEMHNLNTDLNKRVNLASFRCANSARHLP